LPDILNQSAEIIGGVLFLGMVAAYLRGSRDKGTIATLEANSRAQAGLMETLKAELAQEKTARERLAARVAVLERENTSLLAQRPSAEVIAQIGEDVDLLRVQLHKHDADTKAILRKTPLR
jgi:hypothetical protein